MAVFHVDHEHRLLYVETPKVGCTSIKHALATLAGRCEGMPDELDAFHIWFGYQHRQPISAVLDKMARNYRDYFTFALVRDPIERWESFFYNKIAGRESNDINEFANQFAKTRWANDPHGLPQHALIGDSLSLYSALLPITQMSQLQTAIESHIGKPFPIPERNKSTRRESPGLQPSSRAIIREFYRGDFKLFGSLLPAT